MGLLFTLNARADFLFEPYVGFEMAKFKPSGGSSKDSTGITFGGRFGYIFASEFQLGVDYMAGTWWDDASPKDDIRPNNLGIFVGYKFPTMVRLYGVYFFNEEYIFKNNNSSTDYEGTEFKLGVGITELPVINLNVEYAWGTLDRANGNSTNDVKVTYLGVLISVPLTF
jgi:hypothetical protein